MHCLTGNFSREANYTEEQSRSVRSGNQSNQNDHPAEGSGGNAAESQRGSLSAQIGQWGFPNGNSRGIQTGRRGIDFSGQSFHKCWDKIQSSGSPTLEFEMEKREWNYGEQAGPALGDSMV